MDEIALITLTVLALTSKLLSHSKASERDTRPGAWRLVHLTKHQRDLGLAIELNDRCFLHFMVQVIALTRTLADAGEDGETTVSLSDIVL